MIFIVFDNPSDKRRLSFIADGFKDEATVLFPQSKCISIRNQIKECKKVINLSKDGDVIVCWYDFMAVITWWLCRIKHKKRDILALNILLKNKKSIKNRIAKFLYKRALVADNFLATVTSTEYGAWLNKVLRTELDFVLLHDLYQNSYQTNSVIEKAENKIFCGGRNGRDWDLLFKLSKALPGIIFDIVIPMDVFQNKKFNIGSNVSISTDVPIDVFMEKMCSSSAVVLPIETEAPAGLIVLFQAGANNVPVIISDTVTTREYINEERGYLCKNSIEEWKNTIQSALENKHQSIEKSKAFKRYLEMNCNETVFVEGMRNAILEFRR